MMRAVSSIGCSSLGIPVGTLVSQGVVLGV
jgi:hypothetical protein